MSGGPLPGEHRAKLTAASTERFTKWGETATAGERELVVAVLMAIVDGSWRSRWRYRPDAVHGMTWHIYPKDDLRVTVRYTIEFPTIAQVIDIGTGNEA